MNTQRERVVRILVLYLLLEGSLSAHEIKRALARSYVRFWFPIGDDSVDSVLETLVADGSARAMGEGQARYQITRRGSEELAALADAGWESHDGGLVSAALAVSGDKPASELAIALRRRAQALRERRDELGSVRAGAPSPLLARREEVLLDAEARWVVAELERIT